MLEVSGVGVGHAAHLTFPQMTSSDPGAAVTPQVLVSWCCVLLTDFTWLTCFLRARQRTWGFRMDKHHGALELLYLTRCCGARRASPGS